MDFRDLMNENGSVCRGNATLLRLFLLHCDAAQWMRIAFLEKTVELMQPEERMFHIASF